MDYYVKFLTCSWSAVERAKPHSTAYKPEAHDKGARGRRGQRPPSPHLENYTTCFRRGTDSTKSSPGRTPREGRRALLRAAPGSSHGRRVHRPRKVTQDTPPVFGEKKKKYTTNATHRCRVQGPHGPHRTSRQCTPVARPEPSGVPEVFKLALGIAPASGLIWWPKRECSQRPNSAGVLLWSIRGMVRGV